MQGENIYTSECQGIPKQNDLEGSIKGLGQMVIDRCQTFMPDMRCGAVVQAFEASFRPEILA